MPRVLSFFLKLLVSMLGVVSSNADVSITTTSSKGWSKSESFNNLGLTTSSNLSGPGVPAASLTPDWRADGSLSGVTFTAGGDTHSATFNHNGTLATLNAPGKGDILGGHTINGGVETLTVDGVTTATKLDGTQITTSGSDVIGKTETLAVSGSGFQQTTDPVTGSNTTTSYNAALAPTAKNYAAGAGEARDYYTGGLLKEINLARGGKLTFGYSPDGAKDLTLATWPAVASASFSIPAATQGYGYDRAGRIDEIGDESGVRSLIYQNGRHKQTVWNSGALAGYKIVRGLDTSGRETGFELWRGNVMIHAAQSVPNSVSGEVSSVTASGFSAILGRNGARNLESITRGPVTQRWQRGTAGRILLADTNNTVSGAPSFNYKGTANDEATAFDTKGRRLKCATAGGEWNYQYTNGRLTRAEHKDANDNIILGDFSYGFDGIGRRTDKGSANTSDLLNRTLAWENSQNKTVKVNAHPAAQVWFNGTQIPNFTGSYNHFVPSPGPQGGWFAWNTLAVLPGQGDAGANPDAKAQQSGAVWVPPVNESFTFDAAGNRESSALWDFGWDAKNNLVRARTKNYINSTTPQGYDITNAYDAERRRFSKKVNRYQNGSIVEQKVITFLHDGDDIIYERHQLPSGLTTLERKYVWGPDISGTQGGAGGAGGLLLIRETKGNVTIDLYPLYDGSGHVVALADNTGTLQAEYAYGPFGETIHARGPKASSCPFRFQTKYLDVETGLYCYLERPYDPITAQFLSRDPLGEKEDLNLYRLTGGDPINYVDVNGLAKVALDGKGNLTIFGKALLTIAKDAPEEARAMLMAAQVQREETGANIGGLIGNGDGSAVGNVLRAIDTVVGNARTDGREEWRRIAAETGASRDFDNGQATQNIWVDAMFADYAPAIAASANAAATFNSAQRAASEKQTAYQNSPGYKLREIGGAIADLPMHAGTAIVSGALATDITTGSTITWNGWGNGFGLGEVSPGQRVAAAGLMFLPIGRVGGVADDFVRAGGAVRRSERLFGSAYPRINPTGSNMNCVNCAITLDRRLNGSLASAMYGSPDGLDEITGIFGGAFRDVSGMMEIGSILSKSGNGARGIVAGSNSRGGVGHVWNVFNDNGAIRFLDGQSGELPERVLGNFGRFDELQFLLTFPGQ